VQSQVDSGLLVFKAVQRPTVVARMGYAWRCPTGPKGTRRPPAGLALQWWLQQLASATTRTALLTTSR
jgi:hypothetical protein